MSIPFTRYVRPYGEARPDSIERPPEIEALAMAAFDKGVRFDAEVLGTGEVSFTAMLADDAIAHEVVPNGPAVLEAVDRLVRKAAEVVG